MTKIKEANFQKKLVRDLKDAGHRVKKMQSGMGYTVLDLYVRHKEHGAQWWELKTIPTLATKIGLTELQRNEIKDEISAGGVASCVVCCKIDSVEHIYVVPHHATHIKVEYLVQRRKIGEKYDINTIALRSTTTR